MHFTGNVFRPPFEDGTPLLQVTTGCTYNRCSFCRLYHQVPFSLSPFEQIQEDLEELRKLHPFAVRIFLESGDAFALDCEHLLRISDAIHHALSEICTITMYASIANIAKKSDTDLLLLRANDINELNIGLESGYDPALSRLNKNYTAKEALHQLMRLKAAGISFSTNVILGAGGAGMGEASATATAALLNQADPYLVFTEVLRPEPDTALFTAIEAGTFYEATVEEDFREEALLLEHLQLSNSVFFGVHISNVVRMLGYLPGEKQELLHQLRAKKASISDFLLHQPPHRGPNGGIIYGL